MNNFKNESVLFYIYNPVNIMTEKALAEVFTVFEVFISDAVYNFKANGS